AHTRLAAAAGGSAWGRVEAVRVKKVTMLGVASGLVAGLVGITPAAGFVSPMAALAIGVAAGIVCYGGVLIKSKLGYDDALDAFGVHGVGGALGALLTGVFAVYAINPDVNAYHAAGKAGLLEGNTHTELNQLLATVFTWVLAAVGSFVLLKIVGAVV